MKFFIIKIMINLYISKLVRNNIFFFWKKILLADGNHVHLYSHFIYYFFYYLKLQKI